MDTLAKTQADRQYGLDYANTYGQSMDGTMQTQAAKEADRQFALAEGELTGWYKGLPTTTQQQIDIQFAQYQQSTGQQKRDNALQLLQMGMYNPQIAADAGMDDATAQYIANYARQTMQNDLTSQGLANQQAQADIANTQANTNRLNSNFSSGGGRGGSSGGRGSGGGGSKENNPHKDSSAEGDPVIKNGHGMSKTGEKGAVDWVYVAGYGRLGVSELERLVDEGKIKETVNGNEITYTKA